ncbi:MAG: type II secretion system protein [Candidatus Yonathbacteria bacterium]|nr:type II secretion system protein [Candidatus Yonathbacteria bacterium]
MNLNINTKEIRDKGFTLLELLIVVSIIAILSVALVLVLNPAETLKKSRDAQRISDLSTMKTALGLYLTSTSTPFLAGTSNTMCKNNLADTWANASGRIYYSSADSITDTTLDGSSDLVASSTVGSTLLGLTDGGGWIPVNFDVLTGGSPISNLPIDPTNELNGNYSSGTQDALGSSGPTSNVSTFYRYACSASPLAFEINAVLESTAYTSTDNKLTSDGGNNQYFYEVGTSLKILGTGNNF